MKPDESSRSVPTLFETQCRRLVNPIARVFISFECYTSPIPLAPSPPCQLLSAGQTLVDGLAANLVHVGRHHPYPVGLQLRRQSALRDSSSFFGMCVSLLQQPQLDARCVTCWNGVGGLGRWCDADTNICIMQFDDSKQYRISTPTRKGRKALPASWCGALRYLREAGLSR